MGEWKGYFIDFISWMGEGNFRSGIEVVVGCLLMFLESSWMNNYSGRRDEYIKMIKKISLKGGVLSPFEINMANHSIDFGLRANF